MSEQQLSDDDPNLRKFAAWYDASMSWSGRLRREIPILTDVLGPPGDGGLLDAGCGTGHHVIALSQLGYKVVGADISAEMLEIAGKHAAEKAVDVSFVLTPYAGLFEKAGGEFDGLFCLANSLTCSGTAGAVAEALEQFARCLRPGGRFYIETLNFTPMLPPGTVGGMLVQPTAPTAAGPTAQASVKTNGSGDSTDVATDGDAEVEAEGGEDRDGPEAFLLDPSSTQVSKLYIGGDDEPSPSARKQKYRLYPVSNTEFDAWSEAAGLRIDEQWGSALREPYDTATSVDMISVGTRV